jgi:outer membrane protein OmpA-like peptidoglycan-associated protein
MSKTLRVVALVAFGAVAFSLNAVCAEAQFGRRLKDALKDIAENRAIQKVVEHENQAIDATLSAKLTSSDNAAGEGLYTRLKADGRMTAEGISFQPGTATLTAESAAPLKAIGAMLNTHADLRLRVEAYAEDKDVALARAQAIRDALVKAYQIDSARLQLEGDKGKSGQDRIELVQL